MSRLQQCPCGSGEWPEAHHDARGIFLCYACAKCEREKLSRYRPEVLTNPNYEADDLGDDEPLDPGQTGPCPGHEWDYSGTQYGGDDESYHGEGRVFCIHCGADGDA